MRFIRSFLIISLLFVEYIDAKQLGARRPAARPTPVEVTPAPGPVPQRETPMPQPDISKLPKPLDASNMGQNIPQPSSVSVQDYARNKVATLSPRLIDDIFPKEQTIERMVFEFKDQFPGPNKQTDITILYDAIINNPEIKKNITLQNAVPVYKFIKEALNKAWDKKDNLVWSS